MKTIGIIGAGQMGNGIAHVAAIAGYDVVLTDISQELAEKGLATITKNMNRQVQKEKISQADMEKALGSITIAVGLEHHANCDLVIEAAVEKEAIKIAILKELCPHLKPEALLASNTSSISITRLGSATDRPEQFMGMHFMNPVPVMKLVELIPSIATSKETFEKIEKLTIEMGKDPAVSEDFPGFIANRILMPMINEAVFTLYEGIGTIKAIDKTMVLGTNHPMGPLTLADFIGLDTCLAIMNVLYNEFNDSKYRPCPLLVKYVEAGWLGVKSGKGFYNYSGDGEPTPTR
jgi:3-hydroxybutyryl-CoA dehydrogenase